MPAKFVDPFWKQEQDALAILAKDGVKDAQIVRTGSEAVLYALKGKAFTAWLGDNGIVRTDPGFPAEF